MVPMKLEGFRLARVGNEFFCFVWVFTEIKQLLARLVVRTDGFRHNVIASSLFAVPPSGGFGDPA
jgi:hypothetical protein